MHTMTYTACGFDGMRQWTCQDCGRKLRIWPDGYYEVVAPGLRPDVPHELVGADGTRMPAPSAQIGPDAPDWRCEIALDPLWEERLAGLEW